ncbi:hypothetical protein EDD86DRAFT_213816 [Gorgonomyces haynaldii]|nr:hypothetical protein EDD86DRAFT_213816 [Gorgonomyces haynaldii]
MKLLETKSIYSKLLYQETVCDYLPNIFGTVKAPEYGNTQGCSDSYFERDGKMIIINEYKGIWILHPQWFQDRRIDQINSNR